MWGPLTVHCHLAELLAFVSPFCLSWFHCRCGAVNGTRLGRGGCSLCPCRTLSLASTTPNQAGTISLGQQEVLEEGGERFSSHASPSLAVHLPVRHEDCIFAFFLIQHL